MDADLKRDIRRINTAGVLGTLYVRLTLGEILLLFITQCLGVPKEQWALAAALIPLTSVLHLVSGFLVEHFGRRKLWSLICFALARLATPAIILLPFMTGAHEVETRLAFLAAALIGQSAFNAFGTSAWLSWIADIVPEEHRARYYTTRLALNTAVGIVVFFLGGMIVDRFGTANPWGYVIVFGFAFLVGELDLIIHAGVADRPMPERTERPGLMRLLLAPWRHHGFRNLMLFRMCLAFGDSIIGPFAIMYLVEELGLSATEITLLTGVVMGSQAISFGLWLRIGERIGYRNVLLFNGILGGIGILYYWFLTPLYPLALLLILLWARLYYGFLGAGTLLGLSTLLLNVAPDENRSMYFAQETTLMALMMSAGIFVGRWLYLATNPVQPVIMPFVGTRLTGLHVLIGLLGISRILSAWWFHSRIPEARGEAALPRISRILRTNALRIFPTMLSVARPVPVGRREQHVEQMKQLLPDHRASELDEPLRTVIKDDVHHEDELLTIIDRAREAQKRSIEAMQAARARGIELLLSELAESAALHIAPVRARAAANRLSRLYAEGDLERCLGAVHRLAHQTADGWPPSKADDALAIIDALKEGTEAGVPVEEESVLLALYAYLQIVREPEGLSDG